VHDVAVVAVSGGPVAALVASPYLAGLTVSVADRANARWWHLRPASRARWAITAAVVVLLAALGGAASQWTVAWPAYLMLALAGSVLAVVDVEHHRLPDRLIVCAAVAAGAVFTLVAAVDSRWSVLGRAAAAAAVVFVVGMALVLISPRGLGFGDAKLAALLAGCLAWRGWRAVLDGFALGIVLAGIAAVVLVVLGRAESRSHIPLGPFLVVAALVIVAVPP
jgi:leader peptidase (prepilin peptidase) / N-methyltransferase